MCHVQQPEKGAAVAEEWGTRETFVAVITTNLPMVFHLFRTWLTKVFGSRFGSSQRTSYKPPSGPSGFRSISGRGDLYSRKGSGPASMDPITIGMTFTESEERMMEDEIKMNNLRSHIAPVHPHETPSSGIVVSNQIDVTHENLSQRSGGAQSVREAW